MPPFMPVNRVVHKDPQRNKQFLKLNGSGHLWNPVTRGQKNITRAVSRRKKLPFNIAVLK